MICGRCTCHQWGPSRLQDGPNPPRPRAVTVQPGGVAEAFEQCSDPLLLPNLTSGGADTGQDVPVTEPIPAAESYIGWRLHELPARNEHHMFEEVATRIARKRISSNILVATGPVSAGGDQGRDAESYPTRIPDELPRAAGFSASASTAPVVVACTLQKDNLRSKVLGDLASICRPNAAKVEIVAFFSLHPIPEATTHELQAIATETYDVELTIFSGSKIAILLAEPDLIWVARHYLELPGDLVPPTDGEAAPGWYAALLENLRLNHGPAAITFAAQGEVTFGLRHATYDADTNADLPEWLDFMAAFLADRKPAEGGGGDTELSFRACYEIAVAKYRGQGSAADSEDLIRRAVEYACNSERPDIISDTVTLVSYWGGMWASGAARATAAEIAEATERLRAHSVTELEGTDPASHPVRAATLTGALAYLHLLPKWQRAESAGRTPKPVERAAHVGVKLDEADFDASALIDSDLVEFEDAMRYLDQLIELLPSARAYSVSSLAKVFTMFAPAVSDHPLYKKVRDGLDAAVGEVEGDATIGERSRNRAVALAKAGQPLEALSEMHNAKVRWFHGDTIYGTVMAMRFIGHIYADLGLTYAAKMYACCAAALSMLHADEEVKEQAPRALLEAVDAAHRAGCWADAAALTELALYLQHQFEADPWNYEKHPELANLEVNSLLELGAVRKFWPEIEALIREALPKSGWYDRIDEGLKDPENQLLLTEEELQERALEIIDGPIFSDLGRTRLVDFTALGVRWIFTFNNDKTTVLTAEGFIASFQVLLAEVARHEPVLARLVVNIQIDVIPHAPHSVDNITLDDDSADVAATITLSNDTEDFEALSVSRIAAAFPLIAAVDFRASHALEPLLEAVFRDGLTHKITVGRPYEDAADLMAPEHYERTAAATRPASSAGYKPLENVTIAASTKDGPKYDRDEALQRIRERYEAVVRGWPLTIARLLADGSGRAVIAKLREDGWLDWQILMGIANVGLNWRMQQGGTYPHDADPDVVRSLMHQPETEDGPHLPLERVLEDLDMHMFMVTVVVAQGWQIYGRTEKRGQEALRELLNRRYHFAEDDVPHRDLLTCLADDGTLLPLVEGGS